MSIFDFFSREAGQARRRDLEDAITYYIPPELRGLLGVAAEMQPIRGAERAGRGAERVVNTQGWDRVQAIGDTLSEIASVAAPVAAAKSIGMPAVQAVQEGLLGLSATPQAAAVRDFAADEFGGVSLPPLSNAQRTQIAGTFPTYQKALGVLDTVVPEGRALDFGAGLGMSRDLGFDTFEPFPRAGFDPTYRSASDIPDASYDRLTNLNVLNVVPREIRDGIVEDIGRVIRPGGAGVITTRGRDVLNAKGMAGPEPMSVITSVDTYQKGFTQSELQDYLRYMLGKNFDVSPLRLGPAGALIQRNR